MAAKHVPTQSAQTALFTLHSFQRIYIPEQVFEKLYLTLELFFHKPIVFFFAYG